MNKVNFSVGTIFIVFSLVYYFYLIPTQIQSSVSVNEFAGRIFLPETFPQMTIGMFAFVSVLFTGNALKEREGAEVMPSASGRSFFQAFVVFTVGVVYVFALDWLGFYASSPVFLALLLMFFGTRDWRYVVPVSLLVPVGMERFFWYAFQVILPEGSVF